MRAKTASNPITIDTLEADITASTVADLTGLSVTTASAKMVRTMSPTMTLAPSNGTSMPFFFPSSERPEPNLGIS